jgi:hypothetical protein
MNFKNAVGVSYSRTAQMAGDHLAINYVTQINIRGQLINEQGGISSQLEGLSSQSFGTNSLYNNITINGVSFGQGYVSNLQADPDGPDVQNKLYTATVTIVHEGNLDSVVKGVTKEVSKYIESISENYTEQKQNHRRIITHSCSIKLNPPNNSNVGQDVLDSMLKDKKNLDSLFNITSKDVYKFINYTFDDKSKSYNFEESREWVENDLSDDSNIVIQQGSFTYSNGAVTASFSVEITNIAAGLNIEAKAKQALDKAASFINSKASQVFASYSKFIIGESDPLNDNIKISKNINFNRNEAKCSVTITYSNSLDIQNGIVYWEYSIEEQKLADEIITSEQGTVIGTGEIISINEFTGSGRKFENAANFFGSNCNSSNAKSRAGGQGICISESISRNYGEGTINYRYTFSDNKSLLFSDGDGGQTKERKKIITSNKQEPLYLNSTFIIPELKELLQVQPNLKPEQKTQRVTISTNSNSKLSDFVGNLFIPGENVIIDNLSISFSPTKRECICDTTYYLINN